MIQFTKLKKSSAVGISVLALTAYAGSAWSDYVINDDLIVDGSACVGFDCVNGTAFGFDTIRLRENNLRLHFDDTSTAASYPDNDWRLIANDSANGGASKFSIEDASAGRVPFTIRAGARNNALYVDSQGDVGIGTSTPATDLHAVTGDTPTLRLEQDGSSGFTAQTWDMAGNETNFFIRDASNGSTLPFRIRPGAPTSSIDIHGDGNVGIGKASPAEKLHIVQNGNYQLRLENPATGGGYWNIGQTDNSWFVGGGKLVFVPDDVASHAGVFAIQNNGNLQIGEVTAAGADHDFEIKSGSSYSEIDAGEAQFTVSSSRLLKENIHTVKAETILDRVAKVPVVTFDWKQQVWDGNELSRTDKIGLIAEDFHNVFGRGSDKHINGSEVQMALWLSVQELNAEKQALEERNAQLEERIAKIEKQLTQN